MVETLSGLAKLSTGSWEKTAVTHAQLALKGRVKAAGQSQGKTDFRKSGEGCVN